MVCFSWRCSGQGHGWASLETQRGRPLDPAGEIYPDPVGCSIFLQFRGKICIYYIFWLVVWNIWIIFPIILRISSSQLTNSYFSGVGIPPTSIRIYTLIISYLYIYRDRYCAYLLPFLRDCFFDLHVPPSKAHRGMGPRDFAGILTCKTVENPMVSLGKWSTSVGFSTFIESMWENLGSAGLCEFFL